LLKKYNLYQLLIISLAAALFILYPDITWLPFELTGLTKPEWNKHVVFFIFRYISITAMILILVKINLSKLNTPLFKKRILYSTVIAALGYAAYGFISFLIFTHVRHFGSLVLFQFFVISILSSLTGHIITLYTEKRRKEQEIEILTVTNLQSRYDALTNQINPHFFFNSLNGLTSLIRKNNSAMTLNYVNHLSDVFRYILQSDKKGLTTLGEELAFVDSFRYMMEVRFANKLKYTVDIDQEMLSHRLPVLSILPLLDNVVVHNIIDGDHKMIVTIQINADNELVVSNPVFPKLTVPVTNGTGLENLAGRFKLLLGKSIKFKNDGHLFTVYLPLK
jgi:sensor histidine kinase YesM